VSVSLVSPVSQREELGPEVPKSTNPASLLCEDHLSGTQRTDIAKLQEQFAVFSLLPGRTNRIPHQIETPPGATVRSRVTTLQVT